MSNFSGATRLFGARSASKGQGKTLAGADERAVAVLRPLGEQVLHGTIAEVARVLDVKWDRLGAAQLVAEVLVDVHGVDSEIRPVHLERVGDHAAELDLAQTRVAVR